MFERILVPVDFTDKNKLAIDFAAQLAQRHNSSVTLLHVIEPIDGAIDHDLKEFYDKLQTRAEARLREFSQPLALAHIDAKRVITVDKALRGIVSFAMENDIDLVLLSSHKVKLEQPLTGWATLSFQVSVLSQCPVLLVK